MNELKLAIEAVINASENVKAITTVAGKLEAIVLIGPKIKHLQEVYEGIKDRL